MIDGWLKVTLLEKNERPVATSLCKWNDTLFLKKWTIVSGVLKKFCFLYKNVKLQIDPLKIAVPKDNSTPKEL